MIEVDYLAPPAELSTYVSAYYLFRTDEAGFEDLERADIAQYRFVLEGEGVITFGDGHSQQLFPVSLMGPRMKASRVAVKGPARLFGVGLLPAGWAGFTGKPADAFANRIVDAETLFGPIVLETLEQLQALDTIEAMAAVVNARAYTYAANVKAIPHWFIRAVDAWLEERLSPNIDDLEKATNLSRRQVERLCRQLYGAPPKLLVRKYRALRTANIIAHGKGDWQDFVDEGGFYDQPHCIRELKEFVGITPAGIRQHASRLTNKTFDRSQLTGRIAPLAAQT